VATHAEDPAQVAVGIETDRGLLVGALLAAGDQVYAVNPQVVSRYRGRHGSSRAKSDRGDAKVLADLVRTDRHNHRPVAGDSPLAEAVQVLAGPSDPDLGPPAARQRDAQRVTGVLPGRAGRARHRSWPRPNRWRPPTGRWSTPWWPCWAV
jgi:hypothetical protein